MIGLGYYQMAWEGTYDMICNGLVWVGMRWYHGMGMVKFLYLPHIDTLLLFGVDTNIIKI